MRTVLLGLILIAFNSLAQVSPKLDITLMQLQAPGVNGTRVSEQLATDMLSLAERDRRPSQPSVKRFADQLTTALTGKQLNNNQLVNIRESITQILRGSHSNISAASSLRETLTALHLDSASTQAITRSLLTIGEEVRGPDDSPVLSDK